MAFFNLPYYRPPRYPRPPGNKKAKPEEPRTSKPRLLSRRIMPTPIIERGCFKLIWENPNPPAGHDRD